MPSKSKSENNFMYHHCHKVKCESEVHLYGVSADCRCVSMRHWQVLLHSSIALSRSWKSPIGLCPPQSSQDRFSHETDAYVFVYLFICPYSSWKHTRQ